VSDSIYEAYLTANKSFCCLSLVIEIAILLLKYLLAYYSPEEQTLEALILVVFLPSMIGE
jgi:hypothetical protein